MAKASLRLWMLRVHRWSTFVVGALVLFVCVTGSVIVFDDELDRWARPELYAATAGDVGPDSALAVMNAETPGRRVGRLWYPTRAQPVYIGELAGAPPRFVHVDPGTGGILGARGEPVVVFIRHLHASFTAGAAGLRLVGLLGAALLVMMATGIYLWWPGLRKLALGFRVRRGSATLLNYDLHNVTGMLSAPLLALITITGIAVVFTGPTRRVLHALWLQAPEPLTALDRIRVPPGDGRAMRPVAELVRRARDTLPEFDVLAVVPPRREALPLQVRLTLPGVRYHDGVARVLLDPYGGAIVGMLDPRALPPPDVFQRTSLMVLHTGDYGGVPMRIVYVLIGLLPVGLAGTGLVVWWLRRKGRLALAERRAARAA